MKKSLLTYIILQSLNVFGIVPSTNPFAPPFIKIPEIKIPSRIIAPADPAKRCMGEPMDAPSCEDMRVRAVQLGCITEDEAKDLRRYGSYPTCNTLKPKPGEPPSKMLDGWCACGCFAPWMKISMSNSTSNSFYPVLAEIFQRRADKISSKEPYKLVTLSDDSNLSNMVLISADIRLTTFGNENKGLVKITTENNKTLYLTEKHPVLTNNGAMVQASQLRPTDQLVTSNGEYVRIVSLSSIPYKGPVYNFSTEKESKNGHIIFSEELAVGDLFWQASLEDEMNQIFIRK